MNNYSYAIRGTGTSDENDKIAFIIEKEVNRLALHLFFYYNYLVQRLLRLRRRKP